MDVEDKRNDPRRLPVNWQHSERSSTAMSSGYGGGPEDEGGRIDINRLPSNRYEFAAEHYQPWNRGWEAGSAHDPWQYKKGDFVVKSPHRAMVAGEALLRRLQLGSLS
jgi:hypothetical protein